MTFVFWHFPYHALVKHCKNCLLINFEISRNHSTCLSLNQEIWSVVNTVFFAIIHCFSWIPAWLINWFGFSLWYSEETEKYWNQSNFEFNLDNTTLENVYYVLNGVFLPKRFTSLQFKFPNRVGWNFPYHALVKYWGNYLSIDLNRRKQFSLVDIKPRDLIRFEHRFLMITYNFDWIPVWLIN